MLIDQKETHEVVRRIVVKVTADRALHDDLTQEAIIHLWLREQQCPGQTESWYFQSCRYFLLNYLRSGRSVDSTRRHKSIRPLAEAFEHPDASDDASVSGRSVPGLVSARETTDLLTRWLTPGERQILGLLEQGFSVREIAAKLDISHTSVIRYRKRIATLAAKLGIDPVV
ncbi:MAG: sigma-70 family RNA polymerase sigma factor [Verrucomicrobia bacterium]|nr:MAG: sigma-70 family RNA polymerase sigma factor [Verrucomicrobiota bacterium]